MSQSQRFNSSQLTAYLRNVKHGVAVPGYFDHTTGEIEYTGINLLFDNLKLNYENDYFTSAWQDPNEALHNDTSMISSAGVPGSTDWVTRLDGDNELNTADGQIVTLGQRSLDFLKSFDD